MAGASPAAKHAAAVSRNHHGHCGSPRGERAGPSDQRVTWKSSRGPRGQHVEGAGTSNVHPCRWVGYVRVTGRLWRRAHSEGTAYGTGSERRSPSAAPSSCFRPGGWAPWSESCGPGRALHAVWSPSSSDRSVTSAGWPEGPPRAELGPSPRPRHSGPEVTGVS